MSWHQIGTRPSATTMLTQLWLYCHVSHITAINSFWPSDTKWQHRSGSPLARVMACCLMHQAITWTNVDWSSVKSSDIHIRAISQEMPQPSVTKILLKITYLKVYQNLPLANELKTMFEGGFLIYWRFCFHTTILTHQDLNKMAAILQTAFSNSFSCLKIVFYYRFHWNIFSMVKLTISQHWLR